MPCCCHKKFSLDPLQHVLFALGMAKSVNFSVVTSYIRIQYVPILIHSCFRCWSVITKLFVAAFVLTGQRLWENPRLCFVLRTSERHALGLISVERQTRLEVGSFECQLQACLSGKLRATRSQDASIFWSWQQLITTTHDYVHRMQGLVFW